MNNSTDFDKKKFKAKKIILFDGVCNLCNGFIDFIIKRDTKRTIFYASLQSDVAKQLLVEKEIIITENQYETIYFLNQDALYNKSSAILHIVKNLSFGYKILAALCLAIPKSLRDAIYLYIAKNRYRFFGKKETCRLPSPEERSQFL